MIVKDVAKNYGPITALRGVSLTASEGEFLAVTGPSGSGKSTLLNLIGTLDRPDSGTISVGGKPVPPPREAVEFRRRLVGFVFQDHLLLPYLSAQSNVETALLATGVARRERALRAGDLLDEVGLSDRVAIARALANAPRLLLADEPTGALDSAAGDRVLDLLAAMRDRHGMTLIIASHDPAVPARADRVTTLIDGRLSRASGAQLS